MLLSHVKNMVDFIRDVTAYKYPILMKLGPSRPYADVAACIEAGADAILMHSKLSQPDEILQFAKALSRTRKDSRFEE